MKMSIEWHEQCCNNFRTNLENEKTRLRRMQESVDITQERFNKYVLQISTAKKEGRDGFDSEQFMKRRKSADQLGQEN